VVVNSFQLFPPGSPVTAGLLGMKTVFAFQLPLSGSLGGLAGSLLGGTAGLSTPSLGITRRRGDRADARHSLPFNSLSRDHQPEGLGIKTVLLGFQLPLSGSPRPRPALLTSRGLSTPSLGITYLSPADNYACRPQPFNSLSRDHRRL